MADTVHVIAGACDRCERFIVAIDPDPIRANWHTPPERGQDGARCAGGGAHVLRYQTGLIVAGRIDRARIRDEAMQLSGLALAVAEQVTAAPSEPRVWRGRPRRGAQR